MIFGNKRKLSAREARERLVEGYEVLPVEVIRLLVCAGHAAHGPALGGDDDLIADVQNAAAAAENVLNRYHVRQAR